MASLNSSRTRWSVAPPKTLWQRFQTMTSEEYLWSRFTICLVASCLLLVVSRAWVPAFQYRIRQVPTREMTARVSFQYFDADATQEARERARTKILCLYEHDPQPLRDLRQALINKIFELKEKSPEELVDTTWPDFYSKSNGANDAAQQDEPTLDELNRFRSAVAADEKLEGLRAAIDRAFIETDRVGLLDSITHEMGRGSMREIKVYLKGNLEDAISVDVSRVRIAEVAETIHENLKRELQIAKDVFSEPDFIAERVFQWLRPQLMVTLKWNEEATRREANSAADAVEAKMRTYEVGEPLQKSLNLPERKSMVGGIPLVENDIDLLRAEYDAIVAKTGWMSQLGRAFVFLCLTMTCFGLCISYLRQRNQKLLENWGLFALLISSFCATYTAMWALANYVEFRLEIVPLVLFAMSIAIAYQVGLGIMLSTLVVLLFTIAHGYDIGEFVILSAAATVSGLSCKKIRSRTKSVYIGLVTAVVVFPITIGIQFILNMEFRSVAMVDAIWFAGGAGFAGLIMTALLPFLEKWFDIQTDISLLELSDPNHPLLKQLVQRAPGTYNHSINVASIAESAAEAIGGNGLLCRVGAYFHDIGKMRKPEYFVENQVGGENKHDDLVPTMSTLVIIAHVKDGAELARKYHLPRSIIGLIEQHHGTTIVEYFFHRATQQSTETVKVEESNFRYPGPKPQSPEAAVLMLADAVEGACRTLREPGPARIESLVREITKKRLDDGQFDDCSVTLQQIRTIQISLIKSLNAMYHARVKYPEQQTV